jgi:hypothetical protein
MKQTRRSFLQTAGAASVAAAVGNVSVAAEHRLLTKACDVSIAFKLMCSHRGA